MRIIVIVGMPGAGKTTMAEVAREMGATVVNTGDIIRDEIKKRGLPYNKDNDRKIAVWFHEKGRESLLISRVLEKINDGDFVVIEGLRSPSQLFELQKKTGTKPVVVAVEASFENRHSREIRRHRFEKETEKYLTERDRLEISHGLGRLIKMADYTIKNNSTLREFEQNVRVLLKNLEKR